MPGGKRPGAGRPKGSKNERTVFSETVRQQALDRGVTPIQVWTDTIADIWQHAQSPGLTPEERIEFEQRACSVAAMLAPYLHPRLQALHVTGGLDNTHQHAHLHAQLGQVGLDLSRYSAEQLTAIEDFAEVLSASAEVRSEPSEAGSPVRVDQEGEGPPP